MSLSLSTGPFCTSVLLSAVSKADSMIKVAEWQQTYYASDSGIHSGATTVRDDESSTDYSGCKKYSRGSAATAATVSAANATGGVEPASGTLESPTGEKVIVFMVIIRKPLGFIPMTIWAIYYPVQGPTSFEANLTKFNFWFFVFFSTLETCRDFFIFLKGLL